MSYTSPKIIPRVHLSPKTLKKISPTKRGKLSSPNKSRMIARINRVSPKRSPVKKYKSSIKRIKSPRTKLFLTQKESFRKKPTINPQTGRTIKKNGDVYNKLVKLYGEPY